MAHDILIVDDEADIRMLIAGVLKDEGYATRDAADSGEALAAIQARQPTLVILDIWLQGSELDGIAILRRLQAEMPSVPVVMISGHGTIETAVEAIKTRRLRFYREAVQERTGCCSSSRARSRRRSCAAKMPSCGCAPAASSTWSAPRRRSTSCASRSSGSRRPAAAS